MFFFFCRVSYLLPVFVCCGRDYSIVDGFILVRRVSINSLLLCYITGSLFVDGFVMVDAGVFPRISAFRDVAGETSDGHGDGSCKAAGRGL